jgi:glutamyl-tRNA synthetase
MSRDELVARFGLDRVQPSPAVFDFQKLDWMNGVYLRALPPDDYAHELILYLGEQGYDWDSALLRRAAPLVQAKIQRLDEFPEYAGFLFGDVQPDPALLDGGAPVLDAAREALEPVEPFAAEPIEQALRDLAERLELSPRKAFQPIRVAVTGSNVSPGLFESLELLGKEESLRRLSAAAGAAA